MSEERLKWIAEWADTWHKFFESKQEVTAEYWPLQCAVGMIRELLVEHERTT